MAKGRTCDPIEPARSDRMSALPESTSNSNKNGIVFQGACSENKNAKKNYNKCAQAAFPSDLGSKLGPRGGSSKSLFRGFSSFGPSWDPNASKIPPRSPQNHPGPPFLPNFARLLKRFGAKHMEIKQKRPAFLCQNLRAFRLLFHYILWFIPFAEYTPRGNRCSWAHGDKTKLE